MSSTNPYYWYIRKKGGNWYLGVTGSSGDAIDGSSTVKVHYHEMNDAISSRDDIIEIPEQFELGLMKGCADELLQHYGSNNVRYARAYEDAKYDAIAYQNDQANSPLVIKPYDVREDEE